jgi:molecular chaperone DnaK (HSP70)
MSDTVNDIIKAMMAVFDQSGIRPDQVDEVVLTGGTAQFTQIQNRLVEIFGKEKLIEHDIYQSVVGGLSQYATLLKN